MRARLKARASCHLSGRTVNINPRRLRPCVCCENRRDDRIETVCIYYFWGYCYLVRMIEVDKAKAEGGGV